MRNGKGKEEVCEEMKKSEADEEKAAPSTQDQISSGHAITKVSEQAAEFHSR